MKVRAYGISPNVPIDKTLEQIGMALNECAQFASGYGVAIRLEVHGRTTSQLSHIQTIMEIADHPEAVVCWNCNPTDLVDKGLESNFQKVSKNRRKRMPKWQASRSARSIRSDFLSTITGTIVPESCRKSVANLHRYFLLTKRWKCECGPGTTCLLYTYPSPRD